MNRRRGGLGSGLDALLPADTNGSVRDVPIEQIRQNPRQPRVHFDPGALEELAASIREHGIIQPLIVSECADGSYELVAGERRWRAARMAGLASVPALVREATSQQLLELALIENVQRADLNPLEEARAYQELKDDFGLSDDQIARRVGKNNRVTIANTRRLLKLPERAQQALLAHEISAGHGRALLKLDDPEHQLAALELMISDQLNVREAERLGELGRQLGDVRRAYAALRSARAPRKEAAPGTGDDHRQERSRAGTSADDLAIGRELERILHTPVRLSRSGSVLRVAIEFHTDEQLQEFFDRLNATDASWSR